jgi:hypothetical protein
LGGFFSGDHFSNGSEKQISQIQDIRENKKGDKNEKSPVGISHIQRVLQQSGRITVEEIQARAQKGKGPVNPPNNVLTVLFGDIAEQGAE